MSRSVIEDPARFLHERGELHDTWIEQIDLRLEDRAVSLRLDDIKANFRNPPHLDYPDYWQERPAALLFEQVGELSLGLSIYQGAIIGGMSITGAKGAFRMEIDLNQGGRSGLPETWQMWFLFGSLSIIEDKS
jgi:hypothetical protein